MARDLKFDEAVAGAADLKDMAGREAILRMPEGLDFVVVFEALQAQLGHDARIDAVIRGLAFTFVKKEA